MSQHVLRQRLTERRPRSFAFHDCVRPIYGTPQPQRASVLEHNLSNAFFGQARSNTSQAGAATQEAAQGAIPLDCRGPLSGVPASKN